MIRQRLSVEFDAGTRQTMASQRKTRAHQTRDPKLELPGQANICGEQSLENDPSIDKRCVVVAGIAESTIVVGARAIELVVMRVRHT